MKNNNIYDWFRDKNIENKPLSTILREQKVKEKLAMIGTRTPTPTKRSKKHEHKSYNNIRIQITIDCRIL